MGGRTAACRLSDSPLQTSCDRQIKTVPTFAPGRIRLPSPTMRIPMDCLLLMAMIVNVGALRIKNPSMRAEMGRPFKLECDLSTKEAVIWKMRPYNASAWKTLNSENIVFQEVKEEHLGIYRCQHIATNSSSCDIGFRVYRSSQKFFNIRESVKNIILMVEGILLLILVVIPGSILLREKSQKSLKERIQRYKEENENLYEGLNQADQSTYEDITRGQQCMYQDVANYRLSDCQLEQP
ncbi:B-cell antigen receptor complex-associated protein alpha chain isoform X2 [Scyliorhinus torazame]|uniref:B-cell antigen receptor complex-associated protein alpha chain isoform X2 n=1 Tax=Scyliorhinus torazame TaxID=75743 RepID=UPI003B5A39FC